MMYWNLLKLSLFGLAIIKICVVLSLDSFSTLRYDCVIKTKEILDFLPLVNSSVTILCSFVLLIISATISSKTINTLSLSPGLYSSIFL